MRYKRTKGNTETLQSDSAVAPEEDKITEKNIEKRIENDIKKELETFGKLRNRPGMLSE